MKIVNTFAPSCYSCGAPVGAFHRARCEAFVVVEAKTERLLFRCRVFLVISLAITLCNLGVLAARLLGWPP